MEGGYYQEDKRQQALVSVWRQENPFALLEGMWIGTVIMENVKVALQILKRELAYAQQSVFWAHLQRKWDQYHRYMCLPVFIAALFTVINIGTQPKSLSVGE